LKYWARIGTYIIIGVGMIFMIAPFIWLLSTASKPPHEIFTYPPRLIPNDISLLENIREVFHWIPFGRFFLNSIIYAGTVTLSTLFLGSLAGFGFSKYRFPGRDVIFILILGSMMVPSQVTMIPVFLQLMWLGWLDTYQGLIVPGLVSAFGIFLMRQFIMTIPNEYIDAARLDGASDFKIYWILILPLSKPALNALGIFTFMATWTNFLWPLIVISSESKKTLPLGLAYFTYQYGTYWNLLMAAVLLAIIPVIIVFLIFRRYFIKGITLTGIK